MEAIILKHGIEAKQQLTCPICGCEFVCGEYDTSRGEYGGVFATCPCCHEDVPFGNGKPYVKKAPVNTDRENITQLIMSGGPHETADQLIDRLLENGVTFREGFPNVRSYTAFLYEKDGILAGVATDLSTYSDKEWAITFAQSKNWDEVVDNTTGEIVWRNEEYNGIFD